MLTTDDLSKKYLLRLRIAIGTNTTFEAIDGTHYLVSIDSSFEKNYFLHCNHMHFESLEHDSVYKAKGGDRKRLRLSQDKTEKFHVTFCPSKVSANFIHDINIRFTEVVDVQSAKYKVRPRSKMTL